jgi:hypothetical protein
MKTLIPAVVVSLLVISSAFAQANRKPESNEDPSASAPQFLSCKDWKSIRDARDQLSRDKRSQADEDAQSAIRMGNSVDDYIRGYVRGVVETAALLTDQMEELREFGWSTGVAEAMLLATCDVDNNLTVAQASIKVSTKLLKTK